MKRNVGLSCIVNPTMNLFFALLLCLLSPGINMIGAQPQNNNNGQPNYSSFSPSMAIIIVVLMAALFLMGFFSIYVRHCADASGAAGSVRRALSMRNRRAAAARGLEASVIETFPTFSYSEVKDHQIGKGALECAVCLNEFEEEETLRLLPKCDHVFHPECIDAWLVSHVTCPVCRANLVPQAGDEPVQTPPNDNAETNENVERVDSSRNEEIVILQVEDDPDNSSTSQQQEQQQEGTFVKNRPPRSWSIKLFTSGKFRSHSTGHSLVQPGENLDRFTLRLPAEVRKEVMDRATLNRTRSCAVSLPMEGSQRSSYRRIEKSDRGDAKSDRWVFFTRGLSMRSPRVVAEAGEGSASKGSGSRTPVKFPSFSCLDPKGVDENHLFSDLSTPPPV